MSDESEAFAEAFLSGMSAWARQMLTLPYAEFVEQTHPEPIATIGTTPVYSDDIMKVLDDAGITVEERPDCIIWHFPGVGPIDARGLQQALASDIVSAEDLFFPKAEMPPREGPSYLDHDPTKNVRGLRRARVSKRKGRR